MWNFEPETIHDFNTTADGTDDFLDVTINNGAVLWENVETTSSLRVSV